MIRTNLRNARETCPRLEDKKEHIEVQVELEVKHKTKSEINSDYDFVLTRQFIPISFSTLTLALTLYFEGENHA